MGILSDFCAKASRRFVQSALFARRLLTKQEKRGKIAPFSGSRARRREILHFCAKQVFHRARVRGFHGEMKKKKFLSVAAALLLCPVLAVALSGCEELSAVVDKGLGILDKGIEAVWSKLDGLSDSRPSTVATAPALPEGEFMREEDFLYLTEEENALFVDALRDAEGNIYPELCACCTDGEVIYLAMCDGKPTDGATLIARLTPGGSIVAVSEPLLIPRINDMCFNTATGKLVAVHHAPAAQNLTVIDGETLRVTDTKNLPLQIYAITYDETQDCYYAGILYGFNYAGINADFTVGHTYSGRSAEGTQEGIDCDGEFVYFLYSGEASVAVYSVSGRYLGTIALPGITGRAQILFHIGETMYVVCRGKGENEHGARICTAVRAEADAVSGTAAEEGTRHE